MWSLLAAVAWAIWLTHNNMVFNHQVCRSPLQVIYKALAILAQWKILLPAKRREATMKLISKIQAQLCEGEARGIG